MLRPIVVIQKKDQFGIGYKPNSPGKKKLMEKKRRKRIVGFLEKAMEDFEMEIPPAKLLIALYRFHQLRIRSG